jgi:transcriptional regulator NrdR family protein
MMNCPVCGVERSSVLLVSADPDVHMCLRLRRCANGHDFSTWEVHPSQLANGREMTSALRKIERRIALHKRDVAIARDTRSAPVVAAEHSISAARVRQIRAAMRA